MSNNGVRIVHNKLLGGWYIVTGAHQTPLGGRYDSKADAQQSLVDAQARRDNRVRYVQVPTITFTVDD